MLGTKVSLNVIKQAARKLRHFRKAISGLQSTYCSDSTTIIRTFIVMIGWAGLARSHIDSKIANVEFMTLSNGYCRQQVHKSQYSALV